MKIKNILKESNDIPQESLESIDSFMSDLQMNIHYLKDGIKRNKLNKQQILQKIQVMKHNIGSMESELNK